MRVTIVSLFLAMTVAACGSSEPQEAQPDAGPDAGDPGFRADWEYQFPALPVASGQEDDYSCQSVTLDNDEPLYVSAVRQFNEGSWHHSNWFFVPENRYGKAFDDDGSWDCRFPPGEEPGTRFDMVAAATVGGVVFAQSTQTLDETTRFPEGSVVLIPPRSKLIGAVHLVNFTRDDIDTAITMQLETVPASEAFVQLQPLSFLIYSLAIPPQEETRWRMTCPMQNAYNQLTNNFGSADDFAIYYVLGHFHSWGNYFELSYVDEDGSTRPIVQNYNRAGENLGQIVDPPLFANGAPGLRVECGYDNNTDNTLVWGNNGGDEMCMFLAYVGAPIKVVSWGNEPSDDIGMLDGMHTFEAGCGNVTALPVFN